MYADSEDSATRTVLDKVLIDRAYEIALNPQYDRHEKLLADMMYKFFDKKTGSGVNTNEVLAQELYKPVTETFKRRKVYVTFKDNIWAADLAEMGTFVSFTRSVKY